MAISQQLAREYEKYTNLAKVLQARSYGRFDHFRIAGGFSVKFGSLDTHPPRGEAKCPVFGEYC
jgi:hypothetical protein